MLTIRDNEEGTTWIQITTFADYTEDWNHDGDTYTEYGAYFRTLDGEHTEFFSEQIVEDDFTVVK